MSVARSAARMGTGLLAASVLLVLLGLCVGSTGWSGMLEAVNAGLASTSSSAPLLDPSNGALAQIVWDIRLPRTLGAWLAGALLGLSGALAQGLFRNPLADPYLLGSASGAALGVALALLASGASGMALSWVLRLGMTGAAFVGAVLAVVLTMALARGVGQTLRLLLAGVVVGVVLGAATTAITFMHPSLLQTMQSFSLGTTAFVGWQACWLMGGAWLVALAVGCSFARVLDGLSLGEHVAQSLGFHLTAIRFLLVLVLALATGTAVAQTGLIAFVGLAAPHAVRALVHVRHRALLVLSALMGAVGLLAADVLARGLFAPLELSLGVLTALIGGVYLIILLHKQVPSRS